MICALFTNNTHGPRVSDGGRGTFALLSRIVDPWARFEFGARRPAESLHMGWVSAYRPGLVEPTTLSRIDAKEI
jgi:hypothetical protein